jgi:adenylate kinase family enzyme
MSEVIAHIAGASGSGKTTLAKKMAIIRKDIIFKDLDEINLEAEKAVKVNYHERHLYTENDKEKIFLKRQEILDDFIKKAKSPIILVGHHCEKFTASNKFLLDTSAEESAKRAYKRSLLEPINERRKLSEMSLDIAEAQEVFVSYVHKGYSIKSFDFLVKWITDYKIPKEKK